MSEIHSKKLKYKTRLEYSPSFMNAFDDIVMGLDGADKAVEFINEPKYKIAEASPSHRVSHTWSEYGILPERREEGSQSWRRISMKELVWIDSIILMREYGIPLSKIKTVYNHIFARSDGTPQHHLDVAICLAARANPIPVYIIVFSDGYADIASNECLDFSEHLFGYQSFLRISINELLKKRFPKTRAPIAPAFKVPLEEVSQARVEGKTEGLSNEEKMLYDEIKRPETTKVTVKIDAGEVMEIESSRVVTNPKVHELYHDTNYGQINTKIERGKPVSAEVVTKKRIKK